MNNQKPPIEFAKIIDYDAVIIGGGVAGCSVATHLSRAGAKVAVIEQHNTPPQTAHSYLFAPGSLRELKNVGINLAETQIGNTITHAKVYLNGQPLSEGDFPEVEDMPQVAKVVPIKAFNQALLSSTRSAGATVLEGWRAINFAVEANWVTIIIGTKEANRTLRTRMLIGADGVSSIVARRLKGAAWSSTQRLVAARAQYNYVSDNPSQASLYYDNESFPGYSWIFPTSKGQANVGVGYIAGAAPAQETPKALLEKLIQNNPAMHERLKDAQLVGEVEVLQSNLFDSKAPLVGDRLMVIGLAAGLVNPYNGEGLQMGLLSAKWAAETIQSCIANNSFTEAALSPYVKRIEGKFGYGFQLSSTMLSLLRNRSLNSTWLGEFEAMGKKCNREPEYKRIASGVLSGMIFPDREVTEKMLMGTMQQATVTGLAAFSSLVQNLNQQNNAPTENMPQASAAAMAQYASSNPGEALRWGLDAALQVAELAGLAAKQALKTQSDKQNPQNSQQ